MEVQGSLSVSIRDKDKGVVITVGDAEAGITILELVVAHEQFMLALGRLMNRPCSVTVEERISARSGK